VSSQVLGEKHEVEAKPSQEKLQKKPNRPNTGDPRQVSRSKAKHQNGALRKRENRAGNRHHGQPVVFTMAQGGGRTAVRPLCSQVFSLSFTGVRFLLGFSVCAMFFP